MRRILFNVGRATAVLAALVVAFQSVAWAQDAPAGPQPRSWVMGYALTLLAIGLGLVVVCRPGGRSVEVKGDLEG